MRRTILGLTALALGLGAAVEARALSFSLNPGDQIVDIDLSSSAQSLVYDGTTESLVVSADVDVIRLASGPDIILSPGQVTLSLSVSLVPGSLFINSDFFGGGTIVGEYEGGLGMDFLLVDNFDGGGPMPILGGEIDAPGMDMVITVLGGFAANGSLLGTYTVAPGAGDPLFESAMGSTGSLSVQFDNLLRGGSLLTTVCSIADTPCSPPVTAPWPGLQDFDAQPEGVQFTPDVPEPAAGSLLLLGLIGTLWLRAARPA